MFDKVAQKRPVSVRMPTVVLLDRKFCPANKDGFNDKSSLCWNLISRSFSLFERSRVLTPELMNWSISGTENVLIEFGGFNVF